uniref:Uncharacterized protein n=1 Tax=Ditylenchus dipsaci TaxID=166011 RepID=A0A915EAS0_9BILA
MKYVQLVPRFQYVSKSVPFCLFGEQVYKHTETQMITCPECERTVKQEEALIPFVDPADAQTLLKLHLEAEEYVSICYPHNHPALGFHLRNIVIFSRILQQLETSLKYFKGAECIFNFVRPADHSLAQTTKAIKQEVEDELKSKAIRQQESPTKTISASQESHETLPLEVKPVSRFKIQVEQEFSEDQITVDHPKDPSKAPAKQLKIPSVLPLSVDIQINTPSEEENVACGPLNPEMTTTLAVPQLPVPPPLIIEDLANELKIEIHEPESNTSSLPQSPKRLFRHNMIALESRKNWRCKQGYNYLMIVDYVNIKKLEVQLTLNAANPCKDSYDLHDCDQVSECVSEQPGSFQCKCPKGYTDNSPDKSKPGRKCDKDTGCQVCSPNAVCEQTYDGVKCHCKPGFVDQSPNPQSQPGTVCQPQAVNECDSPWLNTCPPNADCIDTPNSYRCACKPGFNDLYPQRNPGHHCEEIKKKLDPCQAGTHDCHANAKCSNKQVNDPSLTVYAVDTSSEYTCTCLPGFLDKSADIIKKPGRICIKPEKCETGGQVCSPNADCLNLADGFTCQCKSGYEDRSPNPAKPGRTCVVKDPCANNNCDSAATCYSSTNGGYTCRCNSGYVDQVPAVNMETQGRNCVKRHPCQDQNECQPPSECVEVYGGNGYSCQCPNGYVDSSPDKVNKPGRVCSLPAIEAEPSTEKPPPEALPQTDEFPCGQTKCKRSLKEVCVNGVCKCAEGEGRLADNDTCEPIEKIPFAVRIVNKGPEPLLYSSEFGSNQSAPYVQISNDFEKDMGKAIAPTVFGQRYITTDVSYITHPKTVNSSWPDGLLLNFTAGVKPGTVDRCELWDQMIDSFQSTNQQIGGGQLKVADDVDLLDPCPKKCGGAVCNAALGEVCIADSVCGCPESQKRASKADHCTPVEGVQIPVWVIRKNNDNLVHNTTFNNPQEPITKQYINLFESGVAQSYPQTTLKNSFVVAEVNDILHPNEVNDTWSNDGIVFNSTVYFKKVSYYSSRL